MTRTAKWIVGLLLGLILGVPAIFVLLIWREFHNSGKKYEREGQNAVQKFYEAYNTGNLDRICETVYGCSLSATAKESWNSYLARVRDHAGSFRNAKFSKYRRYIEPFSVRADYLSSFEKAECAERFELNDFDEHPKDGQYTRGPLKIVDYRVSIDGNEIPRK